MRELQRGVSPGESNKRQTAHSKYLTPGNRFESVKKDLLSDSKAKKPNFIKANKTNIQKSSNMEVNSRNATPEKALRNATASNAFDTVRASVNA